MERSIGSIVKTQCAFAAALKECGFHGVRESAQSLLGIIGGEAVYEQVNLLGMFGEFRKLFAVGQQIFNADYFRFVLNAGESFLERCAQLLLQVASSAHGHRRQNGKANAFGL